MIDFPLSSPFENELMASLTSEISLHTTDSIDEMIPFLCISIQFSRRLLRVSKLPFQLNKNHTSLKYLASSDRGHSAQS